MTEDFIEWSVAIRTYEGESLSGDHYVVCSAPERVLVAAMDGIGHGPQAALASATAVAAIQDDPGRPLEKIFAACHKALRNTRGVVMSLASFEVSTGTMAWLGVGNVEGRLVRAGRTTGHAHEELRLHPGVAGHSMPSPLTVSVLPVARGDVLILATDGIEREYTERLYIGKSAHQIANEILTGHRKGIDDALVLVAKVRAKEV